MFRLVIIFGFVTLARGRLDIPDGEVDILRQNHDVDDDGGYQWGYEAENGITVQEQGIPRGNGKLGIQGQYSYISPEGKTITVTYVADESGFHPSGDLPTPPPIPEAIQRALRWNAAHPEEEEEEYKEKPKKAVIINNYKPLKKEIKKPVRVVKQTVKKNIFTPVTYRRTWG